MSSYELARVKKERAYERYNYAGAALELAKIEQRLAEIIHQHEPLHTRCGDNRIARKTAEDVAFYVVVGRWRND